MQSLAEATRRVLNGVGTDEDRLAMALDLLERLDQFGRPKMPTRPAGLPDDAELITLHERQARGENLGASELRSLNRMGGWRYAVMQLESKSTGAILALLYTARELQRMGKESELARMMLFLGAEYGIHTVPQDDRDDRPLAAVKARRGDIVSSALRTMDRADLGRGSLQ